MFTGPCVFFTSGRCAHETPPARAKAAARRTTPSPIRRGRAFIVADLDAREGKARALLGETRQTLDAAAQMSVSLKAAIEALDAFVHYVSPPPNPNAPPSAPGTPFNPLDYGRAATEVGGMARDLTALLATVDTAAPKLSVVGKDMADQLQVVVDRAFRRGVVIVALLLVGSVFAALAYRALARRLFARPVATDSTGI